MVRRMSRAIVRAIVAAVLGTLAGALLLSVVYPFRSLIALEMDRDLPSFVSGFYGVERSGDDTFVWTADRAVIRLHGLDRQTAWTCTIRVRGAREPFVPLPDLSLSFDGAVARVTPLTNDFQDIDVEVPPRSGQSGLTLTMVVTPTFVPGGNDSRVLGAQVDRVRCAPASWAWPPSAALRSAAVGAGSFALAGALAGLSIAVVAVATLVVAMGQVVLLTTSGGTFGAYPLLVMQMTTAAAGVLVLIAAVLRIRRPPVAGAAIAAVCVSTVLACLKLAALAHPAKPLVDALFHAHRLQWVLSGRYFFTQPLPDGVQFPYAIGLYVAAAPLATLATDHVLLLRIVVMVVEAAAGVGLYAIVTRGFGDRLAGVLAVLLFHCVPLPYIVIGNANLTNAFAQAIAVMVMVAVAMLASRSGSRGWVLPLVLLTVLTALAFLSHVSTFALLGGTLGVVTVGYAVFGTAGLRRFSGVLAAATILAALVATGLYYRHFADVYEQAFFRVRASPSQAAPSSPPEAVTDEPAILVRPLAWHERAADALQQTTSSMGWPVLTLAIVGVWRLGRRSWREPVPLLLVAWGGAWLAFLFVGTMTRVDTQYQRYAAEFLGRINLASYPVVVMFAAVGAAMLWRARPRAWPLASAVLVGAGVLIGVRMWLRWPW